MNDLGDSIDGDAMPERDSDDSDESNTEVVGQTSGSKQKPKKRYSQQLATSPPTALKNHLTQLEEVDDDEEDAQVIQINSVDETK